MDFNMPPKPQLRPLEYIDAVCAAMGIPSRNVVRISIDVGASDDQILIEVIHRADKSILPAIENAMKQSGE
jgi:antitoxin component of RelBE/YafQ-DinJ toxin-antitoxin module